MQQIKTFTTEISFLSKEFQENDWVEVMVKKAITFKEISRTDKDQHKFHFAIIATFQAFGDNGKGGVKLDGDAVYDLTVKAIEVLYTETAEFTELNKNELLADSGALFSLGMWLLSEKITPFFQIFIQK